MRKSLRKFTFLALVVLVVGLLLLPSAGSVKAAHAACNFGDIICDMQQALQQLIDQYVTPLQNWAIFQANKSFYGIIYQILYIIAQALWNLSKGLTSVGVDIGVVTGWISTNFFQPMITTSNNIFSPVVGMAMLIALLLLGVTYSIMAYVRLNVVSLKSIAGWYLAAVIFFQLGPSLYNSMDQLRQGAFSFFYASSLTTMQGQTPFQQLASGDSAQSSAIYGMPNPCSNFTALLPNSGGNVNGIDIALAYQKADGYDVVTGGSRCLGGGSQQPVPRVWLIQNGYFDANISPSTWLMPPDGTPLDTVLAQMQTTDSQAFAGISRVFDSTTLVWFGIVEQVVGLCLMVAEGLTFLSFAVALLFAFFRRTEPIAWSIVEQQIALFIQTIVIAVMQSVIVALYISAAQTGSPLITLGVSVAGLVLMIILLISGMKAVWNAFNRLFQAFGQATGGAIITPGQASQTAINLGGMAAGALATGGATLLGAGASVMAAGSALDNGSTLAQAAGIAFGDNNAFTSAAMTLYRLPGLRDSPMGEAADQFLEGSRLQALGEGLFPGSGIVAPLLGASLLSNRDPDAAGADGSVPLLNPDMQDRVSVLVRRRPREDDGAWSRDTLSPAEMEAERLAAREPIQGDFAVKRRITPDDEDDLPAAVKAVQSEGDPGDFDARLRQDFEEGIEAAPGGSVNGVSQADSRLREAADNLDDAARRAGQSLGDAGNELKQGVREQAAQRSMAMYEGTLTTSGKENVAAVMGDLVSLMNIQRAEAGNAGGRAYQSPTNNAIADSMAQALDLTPLGDGKPAIRQDLGRFQMFADQALKMGLSGDMTEQVVRDVKENDGMSPSMRSLIQENLESRGNWMSGRIEREVDQLERRASMLPNEIRAVGARPTEENSAGWGMQGSSGFDEGPIPTPPPLSGPGPNVPQDAIAVAVADNQARRMAALSRISANEVEVAGTSGMATTAAVGQHLEQQPQTPPSRPTLPMPVPPAPVRQGLPIPRPLTIPTEEES